MEQQNLPPANAQAPLGYLGNVRQTDATADFARALEALMPGGSGRDYAKLFEGRCHRTTVLCWKAGKRRPAPWACEILAKRLEELGALGKRLRDVTRAEIRSHGLIRWHARRRAEKEKGAG